MLKISNELAIHILEPTKKIIANTAYVSLVCLQCLLQVANIVYRVTPPTRIVSIDFMKDFTELEEMYRSTEQ